jgi:hypothetical protein
MLNIANKSWSKMQMLNLSWIKLSHWSNEKKRRKKWISQWENTSSYLKVYLFNKPGFQCRFHSQSSLPADYTDQSI